VCVYGVEIVGLREGVKEIEDEGLSSFINTLQRAREDHMLPAASRRQPAQAKQCNMHACAWRERKRRGARDGWRGRAGDERDWLFTRGSR